MASNPTAKFEAMKEVLAAKLQRVSSEMSGAADVSNISETVSSEGKSWVQNSKGAAMVAEADARVEQLRKILGPDGVPEQPPGIGQ